MSKEAMKLAIKTLLWANKEINGWIDDVYGHDPEDHPEIMLAIKTLEEALAKQEQGELVALETVYETIIHWDEGGGKRSRRELARRIVALYTTPQQRKPMTNEQIDFLNFLYGAGEWDGVWFEQKHPIEKGVFWWRKHMKRLFDYNVKE